MILGSVHSACFWRRKEATTLLKRVKKKSKWQKKQDVLAKDKQAKSKVQPDLRVDTTE